MSITRTTLTDDDGTGTTGTVLNNAWLQTVYDAIDGFVKNWADVAYNAGNFTSTAGSWTVDAGDQVLYRYTVCNKTMVLVWELDNTSVTGTPANLKIAIPGGYLAAKQSYSGGLLYNDNGAGFVSGGNIFTGGAGAGYIGLQLGTLGVSTWANATNATSVRGTFTFEVQ